MSCIIRKYHLIAYFKNVKMSVKVKYWYSSRQELILDKDIITDIGFLHV